MKSISKIIFIVLLIQIQESKSMNRLWSACKSAASVIVQQTKGITVKVQESVQAVKTVWSKPTIIKPIINDLPLKAPNVIQKISSAPSTITASGIGILAACAITDYKQKQKEHLQEKLNLRFKKESDDKYAHDLYLLSIDHANPMSKDIPETALKINQELGLSKFFDTQKLVDSNWVEKEFKKDKSHSEHTVTIEDGYTLTYSYFSRGSKQLLIIGPGFTNSKEKMAPFVHMFTTYDIVILNFRGHGKSKDLKINPLYHTIGIDGKVQLGAKEEKDIIAVVNDVKSKNKYEKTVGLGLCFGAFTMAKAEIAENKKGNKLFDKLILDGMWSSLDKFAKKIADNPALIFNPQDGDASIFVRSIFDKIKSKVQLLIERLTGVSFDQIDITEDLKNIKIPVLMIYGKDDLTITREEFETSFNNLGTKQKTAIITSNPHVRNHLKSKELYKLVSEVFIEKEFDEFIKTIDSKEKIEHFAQEQLRKKLSSKNYLDTIPKRDSAIRPNTQQTLLTLNLLRRMPISILS